jgi:hypothetical protein
MVAQRHACVHQMPGTTAPGCSATEAFFLPHHLNLPADQHIPEELAWPGELQGVVMVTTL